MGWWVGLAAAAALAGAIWLARSPESEPTVHGGSDAAPKGSMTREPMRFALEDEATVFAGYAGSESCRECHEEAYELWQRSHHALAERPLSVAMDRAAFDPPRSFPHGTQESSVRWLGETGEVTAVGLSAEAEAHRVDRVIAHYPLRQFLVPFPGGRWQALEAAYDPANNEWFNVYGEEDRQPGEWGHWTGRGMNWNTMCAGCHNTRLRKNYEVATDTFRTTMAEQSVGCEACHGPMQAHNDWQREHGHSGLVDPTVPRWDQRQVLDYCGFCHARRTDLTGDFKPGDNFFDHQDLVIVDRTDRYYPDGQVWDEDFEYASFLSSPMHAAGVTCLDCHDPHSAKTRLPGNWLCMRCHDGGYENAAVIDPVSHSRHKVFGYTTNGVLVDFDLSNYHPKRIEETGGECVNCHMPQTVYMERHWRHDHGFTIPDPLLTQEHGIPNACNRCHQDETVGWALEAVESWYSNRMDRPTRHRAQWLARARRDDPAAREPLVRMVTEEPLGYWRAAAIENLDPWVGDPAVNAALLQALSDADPLVRSKAARVVEPLLETPSGPTVTRALRLALDDPIRAVQMQAAWVLRRELDLDTLAAGELLHYLDLNADQPAGQMQHGAWHLGRGDTTRAVEHYAKAVAWDSYSAPIRHDYAIVLSMLGRSREAISELEAARRLAPGEAEYAYKLGLALHEAGDLGRSITELERAVQLDPRHARAGYNLGLALNASGRLTDALEALRRAEGANPSDPRIPYAMATILANAGRLGDARAAAARAVQLAPDWADARSLVRLLEGQ